MLSIRVLRSKAYLLLSKRHASDHSSWTTVLDEPKIRSPFDNSHRTLASPNLSKSTSILLAKNDSKSVIELSLPTNVELTINPKAESKSSLSILTDADPKSTIVDFNSSSFANESDGLGGSKNNLDGLPSRQSDRFITRLSKKYGLHIDESLPELEQKAQKTTRATKIGCFVVFGGLFVSFVWFCFKNGRAKRDDTGVVVVDEHSGSWLASFYRIGDAIYFWKKYITEPVRENLLPDPLKYPYRQPKYTVVVEIKNVLVNPEWTYKTGYRFKKRPAVEYFLDAVGYPQFELVLYTSESSMTAPAIVDSLDPNHKILYRLYRECNKFMNGHYVKDLSRLNRDLSKVIYIDFDPKSFQLNPENVLRMKKWEGDMSDTALIDLAELLKTIFLSDVDDVRPILQYYSQFEDPTAEFRRRASMIMEQEKKNEEEKNNAPNQLRRLTSGKFFGFQRHQTV